MVTEQSWGKVENVRQLLGNGTDATEDTEVGTGRMGTGKGMAGQGRLRIQ